MKEAVPGYYQNFQCIADRCKHSCCVGWEIDIDDETMAFYESLNTDLGDRIRKSIEGEEPHFILGPDERCPFLKEDGLCELICECGEEALCEICSLHPRFKNFYPSFTEMGLGLCCEEAARLILSAGELFSVKMPENIQLTEEETMFLAIRQTIFAVLQDRNQNVKERFDSVAKLFGFSFDFSLKKAQKLYASLERLDESWTDMLEGLKGFSFDESIFKSEKFQIFFEQLAVYFVFRHLAEAMWDGEYGARVRFALLSCFLIGALCAQIESVNGQIDFEKMADVVRQYSAEIEYSEENVAKLMAELSCC